MTTKATSKETEFKKIMCECMCRKHRCRTCILTGSLDWYKKPIAQLLVEGGTKVVRTSGGRAWYE